MKMFGKNLEEYAEPADVKRVVDEKSDYWETEVELGTDIPTDFIQIPGSKNKISVHYLLFDRENRSERNYNDAYLLLQRVNESTGEKFRFPTLPEIIKTYFEAGNEKFNEMTERASGYTSDILQMQWKFADDDDPDNFDIKTTRKLIRPASIEEPSIFTPIPDFLFLASGKEFDIKIPRKRGYVKKWSPEGLASKTSIFRQKQPVYWYVATKDPTVEYQGSLIRGWCPKRKCIDVSSVPLDKQKLIASRIVRVRE